MTADGLIFVAGLGLFIGLLVLLDLGAQALAWRERRAARLRSRQARMWRDPRWR